MSTSRRLLLAVHVNRQAPPPEGTRFQLGLAGGMYQDRYWHEREFETVDELGQLADKAGTNLVTLAIAWVLANKAVTAPIIGASRPEQLQAREERDVRPKLIHERPPGRLAPPGRRGTSVAV